MATTDELIELETAAWDALVTEGEAAPFYERMLAQDVVMLMPGGMVIDDRATVVTSMGGPPWSAYDLGEMHVLALGAGAAVVWYRGSADRGDHHYEALFNSTYVLENGQWRLALHQQTPV